MEDGGSCRKWVPDYSLILWKYKRLQLLTGEPLKENTSLKEGLGQVTINNLTANKIERWKLCTIIN